MFLGITPVSSVSNGLYFLTLPLVSVVRVIYRKIRHARYLYIKRNVEKVWGARYTLGARYLSKNTVICPSLSPPSKHILEYRYGRTAVFWGITQRVVATSYRRFGTTCPVTLLTYDDGNYRLSRTVAYPGILFRVGGGSSNSVEDRGQRERGSGGSSPLVRGSGGSCNLVQEISFHIVKFS